MVNFPTRASYDVEKKNSTWIMLACAAVVAAVYISTLFPSVPGGDSGELIISAYQMSIAHPPGYPLFTILGHLFTYLPFGSPAWRVNLMSASCGVLSAVFMYLSVARWSGNHAAGVLSAFLYAFSPLVWTYTIQAEVFSMNNLLVNALLYLIISYSHYYSTQDSKYFLMAYLGSLVTGFGVANQHTIVFIFVPIVFWIFFVVGRNEFLYEPKRWLTLGVFMLLGLAPYLHLYLSPQIHQEKYSWGDTGTIGGFLHHFLRKEYGTFQLYSGNLNDESGWTTRLKLYFSRLTAEVLYVGIPLAVIGLWASLRGNKKIIFSSVGYLIAFCFFLYITVFYYLTNLPIQNPLHLGVLLRFFMQPNAIVCVWIGLGFAFLEAKWTLMGNSRAVPLLFALLLTVSQVSLNYTAMDQHDNMYFYHYGKAILDPLPENAVLLVGGDLQTNIPHYLQLCEGIRPDVDILSIETMSWDWHKTRQGILFPNVTFPGYVYHPFKPRAYSMKQFLDENYKTRQLYIAGDWKVGDPTWEDTYTTEAFGLSSLIRRKTETFDAWEHARKSEGALRPLDRSLWTPPTNYEKYGPETWEFMVANNFWEAYEKRANLFLTQGFKRESDAEKCMNEVISLLSTAHANRMRPSRWTLKYLGAAWDHMRTWYPTNETVIHKIVESWEQYLALGKDTTDTDYDTIVRAVAGYKSRQKV